MAPGIRSDKSRANIFDVAELAGVSIKTVSRVVNKEPNVQRSTREKVESAIHALAYRPNAAARGLSGKRSYVIGLVYENPREFSYMKDVLNGALEACETGGYSLLLRPLKLPNESLADDIRQFVLQTRLDGMVLTAPICDYSTVTSLLTEMKIPCALISPTERREDRLSIACNDEEASASLTQILISQGHKSIGFIKGHPDHGATNNRFQGYCRALEENKIRFSEKMVRQGYFSFESGKDCGKNLMELVNRPSAIIASNDDMAAGVIFEAHEKGLKIPSELSVVGFDDTPIATQIWPPLTTVRQPIVEMSRTLTNLLIVELQSRHRQLSPAPFSCEMVIRSSSGPR